MVIKCDHCGELAVEEDEQVCSSCGIVTDDTEYRSELHHTHTATLFASTIAGARLLKKSKPPIALTYGLNSLQNLCHVMNITTEREAEATEILKGVYASKRYKHKEDVAVMAGCCLYLLHKKINQPISISEICRKLDCSRKKFSHFLKYLKVWLSSNNQHLKAIDEESGVLSHCQEKKELGDPNLPEVAKALIPVICEKAPTEEKGRLMKKTAELVKLAYDCWLFTGRSPRSVVISCAFLCWKSMDPKRKKAPFTKFRSEFSVRESMAKLRIPELKDFLLKLGRKIPSYSEDYVNEDNLLFHLDTILENSETLRNDLLPDVFTEEAVNCKEYATFRIPTHRLPRKEPASAVKYESNMIASEIEISDSEIELYIRSDREKRIIEDLHKSKLENCPFK